MKALSLKQPWLYLIVKGLKTIETRVWNTKYRGDIILCSSKKLDDNYDIIINNFKNSIPNFNINDIYLSTGNALCIVNLQNCRPMVKDDEKKACCNLYNGYSWDLNNLRLIKPFPVKGKLNLFEIDYVYNFENFNNTLIQI
jgi:hypothetical protein